MLAVIHPVADKKDGQPPPPQPPSLLSTAALKAKAWTFEAKAIKFGLESKAQPGGLHHCIA